MVKQPPRMKKRNLRRFLFFILGGCFTIHRFLILLFLHLVFTVTVVVIIVGFASLFCLLPLLLLPFPRSSSFLAFFSGFLLLELLQKNARCLVCFNLLALLRHPNYLKTLVGLLQQVLVTDCCNKSCQLRVARELGNVLYQPLHHLAVPLPERGH